MVVRQERLSPAKMLALGVLLGACAGRSNEPSRETVDAGAGMAGTSGGSGGVAASDGGGHAIAITGGSSANGGRVSVLAPPAGAASVAASGGSGGHAASPGGEAGGALSASECSVAWGSPPSDPGYRGMRGTFDGQALNVEGKDATAWVAFCRDEGPGPTPDLRIYFALAGMSFWLENGCQARVTTPEETTWHELDVRMSAAVVKLVLDVNGAVSGDPTVSGHFSLEGQSANGPVTLDADFYLNVVMKDPCMILPG